MIFVRLLVGLFMIANLLSIECGVAAEHNKVWSTIRAAEKEYSVAGDDPTGATLEKARNELVALVKNAVQLRTSAKAYAPEQVYICSKLTNKYECKESIADDTIHAGESPNSKFINLLSNSRATITNALPGSCEFFRLCTDEPSRMHDAGYSKTPLVQVDKNGGFTFQPATKRTPQVIFLIFRRKGDLYYKKLVWLVKP